MVYIPGVAWDAVVGTDRRLATALAKQVPVLWVDPPVSILAVLRSLVRGRRVTRLSGLDAIGPNICRLRTTGPVGLTRPVMRTISALLLKRNLRRTLANCRIQARTTIVASPEQTFPSTESESNIYFVTDDWLAGAGMMGISARRVAKVERSNLARADIVAGVTPDLLSKLTYGRDDGRNLLLPNGCEPGDGQFDVGGTSPCGLPAVPFAILIGQLNERLDLAALEKVLDLGTPIVVIGPRTERDPQISAALDRFLGHPLVAYLGTMSPAELPAYLRRASVGLTPYQDNEFNRGSFPLKTLEYMSQGLPVVSTDLPASRWLGVEHVSISQSPRQFGELVRQMSLRADDSEQLRRERWSFARRHSWDERAKHLLASVEGPISTEGSQPDSTDENFRRVPTNRSRPA